MYLRSLGPNIYEQFWSPSSGKVHGIFSSFQHKINSNLNAEPSVNLFSSKALQNPCVQYAKCSTLTFLDYYARHPVLLTDYWQNNTRIRLKQFLPFSCLCAACVHFIRSHLCLLCVTNAFPPHHLQLRKWLCLIDSATRLEIQIKGRPLNWNPLSLNANHWGSFTSVSPVYQYKGSMDICMLPVKN